MYIGLQHSVSSHDFEIYKMFGLEAQSGKVGPEFGRFELSKGIL